MHQHTVSEYIMTSCHTSVQGCATSYHISHMHRTHTTCSHCKQGNRANTLLQVLEAVDGGSTATASKVETSSAAASEDDEGGFGAIRGLLYNLVVRALSKEGETEAAIALLTRMTFSEGALPTQETTFVTLANELMIRGQYDVAEEVLEMRDYL